MEKKKFKVTIEETISQTFEIEAFSAEEILTKARKCYKDGCLVVDQGSLIGAKIGFEDLDGVTRWEEI